MKNEFGKSTEHVCACSSKIRSPAVSGIVLPLQGHYLFSYRILIKQHFHITHTKDTGKQQCKADISVKLYVCVTGNRAQTEDPTQPTHKHGQTVGGRFSARLALLAALLATLFLWRWLHFSHN